MNKIKISKKEYVKTFFNGLQQAEENERETCIYVNTNNGDLSIHRGSGGNFLELILLDVIFLGLFGTTLEELELLFDKEYFYGLSDILGDQYFEYKFKFMD